MVTVPSSAQVGRPSAATASATSTKGTGGKKKHHKPTKKATKKLASTAASSGTGSSGATLSILGDIIFNADTAGSTVVRGRCCTGSHESCNHDRSIYRAIALGTSEGSGLAAGNLTVPDDCSVCLRTTAAEKGQC